MEIGEFLVLKNSKGTMIIKQVVKTGCRDFVVIFYPREYITLLYLNAEIELIQRTHIVLSSLVTVVLFSEEMQGEEL